jgi:hypothetical protein
MIALPTLNWPALLVAAAVGLAVGATGATWRADANCAESTLALTGQIITLGTEKHQLELAVAEQNKGVEVAKAQTEAAKAAQAQAEQHAADLAGFSQSRLDRLANAVTKASTCGEVLKGYWEMRK